MTGPMSAAPHCSLVIPVFNGSGTIAGVVRALFEAFAGESFEVVLVDDGSTDASAATCRELVAAFGGSVRFVRLARNFGEHNAVLAGLAHARGRCAVVLDDDGQHPAAEALRLYHELRTGDADVVYGRPRVKEHSRLRRLGSRAHDRLMVWLIGKPPDLYLSSFKAMNRFVIDQLGAYRGAWPYIDALVLWSTRRIVQIDVEHAPSARGTSRYRVGTLVVAWLRAIPSFSLVPLRVVSVVGVVLALAGLFALACAAVRAGAASAASPGTLLMAGGAAFLAGLQLVALGVLGEYLGRLFLFVSGMPAYVVREVVAPEVRDEGGGSGPTIGD